MTSSKLSPAAQAVLRAVTQREYSLDPEDIPNEASRLSSYIATALRAAVSQAGKLVHPHPAFSEPQLWAFYEGAGRMSAELRAIADELEQLA